jgi:hypothetical protein
MRVLIFEGEPFAPDSVETRQQTHGQDTRGPLTEWDSQWSDSVTKEGV